MFFFVIGAIQIRDDDDDDDDEGPGFESWLGHLSLVGTCML